MKPSVFRSALAPAKRCVTGAVLITAICLVPLAFSSTHAAGAKGAKGSQLAEKTEATPVPSATPEGQGASKEIPIPLPIGDVAKIIKVPSLGAAGQTLSQLMSMKAKRIDNDHVEMEGTKIDLNQADGKSDYHIDIPTSIFDLKTRIISSEHPVVIRTQEFELTGEKMRFDTIEKSGELIGKVHMVIHNLKATAGIVPQ